MKKKVLLYSVGNCIQYPVIKPQWKRIGKRMYIYKTSVTLLYSRNQYNIVTQVYINETKKNEIVLLSKQETEMWSLVGVTGLLYLPQLEPVTCWSGGRLGLWLKGRGFSSSHPSPRLTCLPVFQICPTDGNKKRMRMDKCFLLSKCLQRNYSWPSCFCNKCIHCRKILYSM